MKIKRLVMLLVFAILLAGCSSAQDTVEEVVEEDREGLEHDKEVRELEEINFILDWTPNTNHTGIYVALEKGYYEDEGLAVKMVQPPEGGAETIVGTGYGDFGVSFQDYMAHALTGSSRIPITAVATILQHNHSGIISRAGEGMDRPKGLEGKKYATWDMAVEQTIIRDVMEEDGGDFEKVIKIPSTVLDEVTALRSKEVDAIWAYYGWGGIAAEVQDFPLDYFAFKDIDDTFDFYSPVIITSEEMIKDHPETVEKFLRATKKGYEFAIENPEEGAKILLDADPSLDEDLVMASQKWMTDKYVDEGVEWGYMDPDRWSKFYAWLNENALLEGEIDPNEGFTNDFLP